MSQTANFRISLRRGRQKILLLLAVQLKVLFQRNDVLLFVFVFTDFAIFIVFAIAR